MPFPCTHYNYYVNGDIIYAHRSALVDVIDNPCYDCHMIQHVQIAQETSDAVAQAAHAAGLSYDVQLALIVADWADTWNGRQAARREFIAGLESAAARKSDAELD